MSDKRIFEEEDGINEEYCVSIYDNSYDFYMLVLKTFLDESNRNLNDLREKFEADDAEGYRIVVHSLKSSAGSVGANDYAELASRSNEMIKDGNWEAAKEINHEVIDELVALRTLIEIRLEAWEEN